MAIHMNGETRYEGQVLSTYERNKYHDSDFYARVWDDENEEVTSIKYDTTRFAGGGHAVVDATDETIRKVDEHARERLFDHLKHKDEKDSREPQVGKKVKVVSGRKVEPGTTGILFWIGEGKKYSYHSATTYKVGISPSGETDDEGRHPDAKWTYKKHLEVVNPEQYDATDEEIQAVVDSFDEPWKALKRNLSYAEARLREKVAA
jgi:hypothetical protein